MEDQPQVQYSPTPPKNSHPRLGKLRGAYRMKRPEVQHPEDQFKRAIALTRGQVAIVDLHVYDWLMESNWFAHWSAHGRCFYAVRNSSTINGKKRIIYMHREIMGIDPNDDRDGDHKDRNELNNCGFNLRYATNGQSAHNKGKYCSNKSGFKGVSRRHNSTAWVSQIQHKGEKIHLGYHVEKEDAARAYDAKAIELHGEFAVLNFPQEVAA